MNSFWEMVEWISAAGTKMIISLLAWELRVILVLYVKLYYGDG